MSSLAYDAFDNERDPAANGRLDRRFPVGVAERLGFYVYRLIDPRNGETFYVGKGRGDRIFQHIAAAEQGSASLAVDQDESLLDEEAKLPRIRAISAAGLLIVYIVHRHGLSENEALAVEAALIDAFPGLTNKMRGRGSDDFGARHVEEIIRQYAAPLVRFTESALLININDTFEEGMSADEIYNATRFAWRLDARRAARASLVVAHARGLIREVYVAQDWLPATKANFPELAARGGSELERRFGFIGSLAPEAIRRRYRMHQIEPEMRRKGAANPIRYVDRAPLSD